MKMLESWLFKLPVPAEKDAHRKLVDWLRINGISHLFQNENRQIQYVNGSDDNGDYLIGRSSVKIHHPSIQPMEVNIDVNEPICISIILPADKIVRPPKLKYEAQSNTTRTKSYVRPYTKTELEQNIIDTALSCGLNTGGYQYEIFGGNDIRVLHKRQNLTVFKKSVLVIYSGYVHDLTLFNQAWNFGVGKQRVYGFGMLRIHNKYDK